MARSGDSSDGTTATRSDGGRLSASELSQAALTTVAELTGYRPEAVTALQWDGEYWQVTVDVLELLRIPSTTDVLGSYAVTLDERGTLRGYMRTRRFQRGQIDEG
jgi:hypothetical protein